MHRKKTELTAALSKAEREKTLRAKYPPPQTENPPEKPMAERRHPEAQLDGTERAYSDRNTSSQPKASETLNSDHNPGSIVKRAMELSDADSITSRGLRNAFGKLFFFLVARTLLSSTEVVISTETILNPF